MSGQKNKKKSISFKKWFKKLDIFGLPVTLVHEGNTTYKTEVGSFFTTMMVICLLTFVSFKLQTLVNQDSQQSYSMFSSDRDLYDMDEKINLAEGGFMLAFGNLWGDIPIEVGRLVPYHTEWFDNKT